MKEERILNQLACYFGGSVLIPLSFFLGWSSAIVGCLLIIIALLTEIADKK